MENDEKFSPESLLEITDDDLRIGISPELVPNLMHNLPGMAYRCKNDSKWTMLFISEGCTELTGYFPGELIHNSKLCYDDLILEEDRELVRTSVSSAVKRRVQFQMEYRIKTKSGQIKWVWEQGNAVYDEHNSPVWLDGFIADITSRIVAEERLKHAAEEMQELNATKDKFFSLIAHDLQNPVYAIISLSEFLGENIDSVGRREIEDFLLQVNSAARGIYSLLENLLDWAKLQTGQIFVQKEFVSLVKVVNYAIAHYSKEAAQKGIEIDFSYDIEHLVESDLRLVSSILRNLISNALKYSYPKSTVFVNIHQSEGHIHVSVTDSGVGISRRHLQKIFRIDNELKQYGTANESGSGLGLILVHNFASILGAKVMVESKLNHGSKFTLRLPSKI